MFEAEKSWTGRKSSFARGFRYQYILSEKVEEILSFRHHAGARWNVHHGNALPFCRLRDEKGCQIGFLLGIAVGPTGLICGGAPFLPLDSSDPDFWNKFETYIVDVAGRYAFVLECAEGARLYTDPVGMIGAVYNREDRYVASSVLLAVKRKVEPNPKFDFELIEKHGGKLSLFHTADAHVKRLKPNHYLDLANFDEHRFWPKTEDFTGSTRVPLSIYDEISARTRFNVGEITGAYKTALPVSGGQDSRLLLAMSKPHLRDIGQIYTHINNYATRRDDAIAKELCRTLDVPHESHDRRSRALPKWEVRRSQRIYQQTLGVRASLPKEYTNGVITGVQDGAVILRGHQTDILRAVYVFEPQDRWHEVDWQIERLLIVPRKMFCEEVADRFRPDFEDWQATLPENARQKAADFMFLEVYYNSTIGSVFPALWRNFYLSPFNSRRLIGLSLLFSERERRQSVPVFDIIERSCPQLSSVPFDFELPASLDGMTEPKYYEQFSDRRTRATSLRFAKYLGSLTD
ncbi:MAG: hypothetical protein JXR14_09705 [Paracoccaceae bacterium]